MFAAFYLLPDVKHGSDSSNTERTTSLQLVVLILGLVSLPVHPTSETRAVIKVLELKHVTFECRRADQQPEPPTRFTG